MLGAVPGEREVVFSWSPPPVTQRNGVITGYTISCSPSPSSLPHSTSSEVTSLRLAGFSPGTSYSCSLVASNSQGSGPPANSSFKTKEDNSYFQLHLGGLLSTCSEEVNSERSLKLEHITDAVVKVLKAPSDIIENTFFVCYPESPSFVTYRASLEGTSETDSSSLVSLIEAWVRGGGASVIVTGVLMTVDSHCSVAISSPSEPECSPTPPAPTAKPAGIEGEGTSSSDTTTPAITAGVVVVTVAVIIAVAIVIVAVVFLGLRHRRGGAKLKSSNQRYESSTPVAAVNVSYGKVKRGEEATYEMMDISAQQLPRAASGPVEDYEEPVTPRQPLPTIPPSKAEEEAEDDTVYDVIPGDQ
ncbi:hypothetical protein GBAR_LOCUS24676 [Geodia barretti]|nr:hypothetical protein GBAR_LOCUS24676 [Geodia barretti]